MEIPLIVYWKNITSILFSICCISLILAVSGCGVDYSSSHDENDPSNTGSYACSLKWPEDVPTLESKSALPRAIDCNAAGIVTVAANFYDESGSNLTGDEWSCSLHEGTIYGIPAGTNRRLVVTGEDASGIVLYQGEQTGIEIVAGQTTQGEQIEMEQVDDTAPSAPTNVVATAGDGQVAISWDAVSGATSYNIYWATWVGVSKIDHEGKIGDITAASYTHTGLTNDTKYFYVVTGENSYGESDASNEVNATPFASYPDTVVDTISVGRYAHGIAVTPDGSYVYVGNAYDNTVSVIQTSNNTVIDTISVGNWPKGIAVTPDGSYVYVANWSGRSVSVIQTSNNTVIETTSVGDSPRDVAVTPDGSYVYVTNDVDDTLSVIQTAENAVIDTISVGNWPHGIAVTPDGSYVYVANTADDTLSVIRISDNTVVDVISGGDGPYGLAVSPDGSYVYVANGGDDTLSVIQTSDNTVIDTISGMHGPHGIAVTPDGSYVYVANSGWRLVSVIRTSDNALMDTISWAWCLDCEPEDVALTPDGAYVYVTITDEDTVLVIGLLE